MSSHKITEHFTSRKIGGPSKAKQSCSIDHKKKKEAVAAPSTSQLPLVQEQEQGLLKQFDLNWQYGPCIGLSRIERWDRAKKFGLNPPEEVRDLILSHSADDLYTECLWNDNNTL